MSIRLPWDLRLAQPPRVRRIRVAPAAKVHRVPEGLLGHPHPRVRLGVLAAAAPEASHEAVDPGEPWGERAAADTWRLQVVAAAPRGMLPPRLGWNRFLRWAGERLTDAPSGDVPASAAAAASAAMAAAHGPRAAFDLSGRRPGARGHGRTAALLALRCVVERQFAPDLLPALLRSSARRQAADEDPWAPLLCAWHACGADEDPSGFVTLTAGLVATDLRARALALVGRDLAVALRRGWGQPVPDVPALAAAVRILRAQPAVWSIGRRSVWPSAMGGPDPAAFAARLSALLGPAAAGAVGAEVLLDDGLALSAVLAVMGRGPEGAAHAASAAPPPPLHGARAALLAALRGPLAPGAVAALPVAPDFARVFARARATADPSVALGTPFWLVGDRGALLSALLRTGQRAMATEMRTLLGREDLQRDLRPFWILRGHERDTASVHALARWLHAESGRVR